MKLQRSGAAALREAPSTASVLLVDDDVANLVALEAILEPLAIRPVRARSGPEALRCVLDEDFAVILMDVRMPGLDGLETAALIKQRPRSRGVPIIFVSAHGRDAGYLARGYQQGGVDYLLKPYEPEILRAKVAVFAELQVRREQLAWHESVLYQREREALTRESEHRFRVLTDAMPLCLLALRPRGDIYYGNRVWLDFSGLAPEAGAELWTLPPIHPDDRPLIRAAWDQALRTGEPFELQCRLRRHRDGAYRWHLARAVPERSFNGEITGWVATATDVDDQRRAEEALGEMLAREQQARREAEDANRLKDEFLAMVSHELRTPLTAILGWARVLRTSDQKRAPGHVGRVEVPRALESIERNALAQARLIEDLLDVSRISTGKLTLEIRSVDLRAVALAAVDTVRPAAEAKGVTIDLELATIDAFAGNPDRLQQVFWNLVANGVKFTPRDGRVTVTLAAVGAEAALRVRDTGQGISATFLPHVFERFRQADTTSTRAHGGLGLGLSLVRYLVELHGGTVHVESEGEGQGAEFTVLLPCRAVAVAPGVAALGTPRLEDTDLRGVRVLVVDDEADARELISAVLEGRGAEVLVAGTVADALAILLETPLDVLISDLAMPREDGYALLQRVRSLAPEEGGAIPAVALTAYAAADVEQRTRAAGFQVHVTKPVDPGRLAAVVAALAGRQAARGPR